MDLIQLLHEALHGASPALPFLFQSDSDQLININGKFFSANRSDSVKIQCTDLVILGYSLLKYRDEFGQFPATQKDIMLTLKKKIFANQQILMQRELKPTSVVTDVVQLLCAQQLDVHKYISNDTYADVLSCVEIKTTMCESGGEILVKQRAQQQEEHFIQPPPVVYKQPTLILEKLQQYKFGDDAKLSFKQLINGDHRAVYDAIKQQAVKCTVAELLPVDKPKLVKIFNQQQLQSVFGTAQSIPTTKAPSNEVVTVLLPNTTNLLSSSNILTFISTGKLPQYRQTLHHQHKDLQQVQEAIKQQKVFNDANSQRFFRDIQQNLSTKMESETVLLVKYNGNRFRLVSNPTEEDKQKAKVAISNGFENEYESSYQMTRKIVAFVSQTDIVGDSLMRSEYIIKIRIDPVSDNMGAVQQFLTILNSL